MFQCPWIFFHLVFCKAFVSMTLQTVWGRIGASLHFFTHSQPLPLPSSQAGNLDIFSNNNISININEPWSTVNRQKCMWLKCIFIFSISSPSFSFHEFCLITKLNFLALYYEFCPFSLSLFPFPVYMKKSRLGMLLSLASLVMHTRDWFPWLLTLIGLNWHVFCIPSYDAPCNEEFFLYMFFSPLEL